MTEMLLMAVMFPVVALAGLFVIQFLVTLGMILYRGWK